MGYNLKVIGKFLAKDVDLKKKYTKKPDYRIRLSVIIKFVIENKLIRIYKPVQPGILRF